MSEVTKDSRSVSAVRWTNTGDSLFGLWLSVATGTFSTEAAKFLLSK